MLVRFVGWNHPLLNVVRVFLATIWFKRPYNFAFADDTTNPFFSSLGRDIANKCIQKQVSQSQQHKPSIT